MQSRVRVAHGAILLALTFAGVGAQAQGSAGACGLFSLKAAGAPQAAGSDAQAQFFTTAQRVALAQQLGVGWMRVNVSLNQRPNLQEAEAARRAGFKVLMHVTTRERGEAAPPVADLGDYQRRLAALLDRFAPDVLAVENEEVAANFVQGTPQQYLDELNAAAQVARPRGVKLTNGAITSRAMMDLLGQASGRGDRAARNPRRAARDEKAADLLAAYRTAPIDYVNLHWYQRDPAQLERAVAWLQAHTGKPVISSEMGQYDQSAQWPADVVAQARRLGMAIVIWFNGDGNKAFALANADGSLRPAANALAAACR